MLTRVLTDPLSLAAAQAGVTGLLALMVAYIAWRWQLHVEREIVISLARGLVQVVVVGTVLLFIFRGPFAVGILVLLFMIFLAAHMAARRAEDLPDAFRVSLYSILIGSGVLIGIMVFLGVIETRLTVFIPVSSMLIANSMNTASLAFNRFRGELVAHRGHIEAALALGAAPQAAVMPYIRAAVLASLIPRVDSLRSLGIVWIPGVMTGMLLGGSHPVQAAFYQFVIVALILTVSAITAITAVLLMSRRIFTRAEQLRPEVLGSP